MTSPASFSAKVLSPIDVSSSASIGPSVAAPSANVFPPNLAAVVSPAAASSVRVSSSFPFHAADTILNTGPVDFLVTSRIFPFIGISECFPEAVGTGVATTIS